MNIKIDAAINRLVTAATIVGAVILLLMMMQIVVDVALTNILKQPIPGNSVIVTHYYMVAVVFLPIALAEKRSDNITVDIIYQIASSAAKNRMMYFSWMLSLIICVCMIISLWQAAMKKMHSGAFMFEQEISFTIWPAYFILPISFGLMALVLASHILTGPEKVEAEALKRGL